MDIGCKALNSSHSNANISESESAVGDPKRQSSILHDTRSGLGIGLAQNQHWLEEEVCENNKNANLASLPTN